MREGEGERERVRRIKGLGRFGEPEQVTHHPSDLGLVRRAVPDQRLLGDGRRVLDDVRPCRGGAGEHDTAALADAQRGLDVARGERGLDHDHGRFHLHEELVELRTNVREPRGHVVVAFRAQDAAREELRPLRADDDGAVADHARPRVDAEHDRNTGPGFAHGVQAVVALPFFPHVANPTLCARHEKAPMSVHESRRTSAVIVAAGQSTRLRAGGDAPRKPFLVFEGLTVLEHACAAFDLVHEVEELVIVGNTGDLARLSQLASSSAALRKVSSIVPGGELRTDSVRAGVEAANRTLPLVAIHDAARPLVTPHTIERAIALAAERGAAVVATPVVDTIKTSSDGKHAQSTLDRSVLWNAQTPQVFRADRFRELLDRARTEGFRPTDDSALWERFVGGVPLCEGDPTNLKITTPSDVLFAGLLLRARRGRREG